MTFYGLALIAGGLVTLIGLREYLWPRPGGHRHSRRGRVGDSRWLRLLSRRRSGRRIGRVRALAAVEPGPAMAVPAPRTGTEADPLPGPSTPHRVVQQWRFNSGDVLAGAAQPTDPQRWAEPPTDEQSWVDHFWEDEPQSPADPSPDRGAGVPDPPPPFTEPVAGRSAPSADHGPNLEPSHPTQEQPTHLGPGSPAGYPHHPMPPPPMPHHPGSPPVGPAGFGPPQVGPADAGPPPHAGPPAHPGPPPQAGPVPHGPALPGPALPGPPYGEAGHVGPFHVGPALAGPPHPGPPHAWPAQPGRPQSRAAQVALPAVRPANVAIDASVDSAMAGGYALPRLRPATPPRTPVDRRAGGGPRSTAARTRAGDPPVGRDQATPDHPPHRTGVTGPDQAAGPDQLPHREQFTLHHQVPAHDPVAHRDRVPDRDQIEGPDQWSYPDQVAYRDQVAHHDQAAYRDQAVHHDQVAYHDVHGPAEADGGPGVQGGPVGFAPPDPPGAAGRRSAETELIPAYSDQTQLLPAVGGGYSWPPVDAAALARRPRPRPRPRPAGATPEGYGRRVSVEPPARSTVYVSRHAAEPA